MYAAILSTWALLAGLALLMLGNGLQGTLLGVRAQQEDFGTIATGLVMTSYFAGFLIGSVAAAGVVRRVGHIRVFAALASCASAAVLLHALLVTPWFWAAARFATGFCFAGLYVITESWLNDRATNETRGALLSVYMLVSLGGMICGQLLLNTADPLGFGLFILSSVLVSLAVVPIALTATPAPNFGAPSHVSLRQLYDTSPLGVIGMGGQGIANGALISLSAVYAQQMGMSIAQTAWFASAPLLGGMLFQWPVGKLSDRFDRRKVLLATALAASALGLVSSSLAPGLSAPAQMLCAALLGGMTLPQYSLSIAHTNDHLQPAQMVAASATLVLVSGVGLSIGPTLAATLMELLGTGALFLTCGLVEVAIAAFAVHRMFARKPVPLAAQGPALPLSARSSPVATQVAVQVLREGQDEAQPAGRSKP